MFKIYIYYDIQIVQIHLYHVYFYLIQAASDHLGKMVEAAAAAITVSVLAFYYSWKLALVVTAFLPLLVLGEISRGTRFKDFAANEAKCFFEASAVRKYQHILQKYLLRMLVKFYFLCFNN